MKKILLSCILSCTPALAADRILIGGSIDWQRAISLSQLQVSYLLNEKHTLKETMSGGEIKIGYSPDRENRIYLSLETGHRKKGFHHYNASFEYNRTTYLNRYWSFLMGGGIGYSIASLDKENVMIGDQSPGELHYSGLSYGLKTGILFSINQYTEIELAVKGKHMLLGDATGSIIVGGAPQEVNLNMDKTFTFSALVGLNLKF